MVEEVVEEETDLKEGYVSEEKYMADMGAMKAEIEADIANSETEIEFSNS